MFNVKRFDPSAPTSAPSTSSTVSDLAAKIEERRQKKRKAGEAGLEGPSEPTLSVPDVPTPAASTSVVEEWKPAPGESPAEREKRIKREKRAQKLGVSFDDVPRGPAGSNYVPPPAEGSYGNYGQGNYGRSQDLEAMQADSAGMGAIHPDRMAAPALAKEAKIGEPKEKTPAKAKYLKKKKARAAGKKRAEPLAKPKNLKKAKVPKVVEGEEGVAKGGEEASDEEEDKKDQADKKREEILKKKEERKVKRDAKKAELKKLKAEGGEVPAPTPRVFPSSTKPISTTKVVPAPSIPDDDTPATPSEPTVEELEAAAEEEQRLARKQSKRIKRTTRRLSPAPPSPTALIPTQAPRSPSPIAEIPPIPQGEEPAPLLRLPSATRPAPPSAKTLSLLNVHSSVRNKLVVDPEFKLKIEDPVLALSERGKTRLNEMGVVEAFAVQTSVLPILLGSGLPTELYTPFAPPRDVCVSAPTGSGKTLSYVMPIIETLEKRVVTRLRALVVLPTRDLVAQVRATFEAFGKGTGLKVGTATGQHSFAHEQAALVGEGPFENLEGGASQIDILIATPGRLMDHIRATPGFSLQHLRYLVIDEADRLLNQSFHEWLPSILAALKPPASSSSDFPGKGAMAPDWWDVKTGRVASDVDEHCLHSCQKLLFSATLSRDPAKIDALHLSRPIFVSVEDALDGNYDDEEVDDELKFTLPATLKEFMIVSPSSHKPLYLFHLLHTISVSSALCFTKSVEAAVRLAKLVDFFQQERLAADPEAKKVVVHTYSSDLSPSERNRVLASFKRGEIQMLICSDLIARGIDLPDVSHVISYDIPTDMRKYVHRVGRTARAGKAGEAWSLVEDQEAAPFKAIMNGAQHFTKISRVRVKDTLVEPFVAHYQTALEKLRLHFATGRKVDLETEVAATA
ncbi:ATP-dependent RNA helicase DDX51/DBP6, partial [Phenoliferia sp. Uapishka_3]